MDALFLGRDWKSPAENPNKNSINKNLLVSLLPTAREGNVFQKGVSVILVTGEGAGEGAYVAGGMHSWGACDCGGICGCTRCVWLEGNVCGWGQAWLGAHTGCVLSGGRGYAVWGTVCCLRGGVQGRCCRGGCCPGSVLSRM